MTPMRRSQTPPPRRTALAWTLRGAVAALLTSAAAFATAAPAAQLHALAVDAFRAGRFPEAYGRFVRLADQGDAEAARLALWMYRRGPTLFGREWDATPEQLERWSAS